MADDATPTETPTGLAPKADEAPKPITMTPAQLDERLTRERAKYADYDQIKSKLAELQDANKSEIERANEARQSALDERDDVRTELARLKIAVKFGVNAEDAELFLTGADEETLTKQAERLAARDTDRKRLGNVVPSEGANVTGPNSDDAAFARLLLTGPQA